MAKVDFPSSREIYGPLKGIVDFYYHKGQLCARRYPDHCKQPHTPGAIQNWDALRAKWHDFRFLSENDKNGYRTVAGGGHFTWVDMFSKIYMTGYHINKRRPPMVYNVTFEWAYGALRLCYTATEDCKALVYYERDWTGHKVVPWKWMFEMPSPPPPNCSQKLKIKYTFSQKVEVDLKATGDVVCSDLLVYRYGYGKWLMLAIKGGKNEGIIFRTGAWYLAN